MSQTDMFFRVFFVVKIDIDLSPKDDNFIQLKGKIKNLASSLQIAGPEMSPKIQKNKNTELFI